MEKVYFAGGCFWGVERVFKMLGGVVSTTVGYAGGSSQNPTYEEVCKGATGHAEALEVEFDPEEISLRSLYDLFWAIHDPTSLNKQGNDVGTQYRSALYYTTEEQKELAERDLASIKEKGLNIVTEVAELDVFYPAEDYHQDYLDKNPGGYCHIEIPYELIEEINKR